MKPLAVTEFSHTTTQNTSQPSVTIVSSFQKTSWRTYYVRWLRSKKEDFQRKGHISRRVILKAQFLVVSKQHLFWLFDAFFSLFFEEIVVLHGSTNALVSGLPSPSSLNPLPHSLPPSTFQQTHRHTNTLKAQYSGYTSYDSNLLFVNKVLEVFFVNTGRLLSNQISRISVP